MRGTGLKANRFIVISFFLGALLAFGTTVSAAPPRQDTGVPVVEGIRFGASGGKTRIVIDFSGKPDFRAFLLDKPWRLAVDIPQGRWRAARSGFSSESLVRGWRSGTLDKDGLSRVIFDLARPAVVVSAFTIERSVGEKDRVVIDLKPSSESLFRARVADVFGNRDLRSAGARPSSVPHSPLPVPRPSPPASAIAAARNRAVSAVAVPPKVPSSARGLYTVVVDAGHGGDDPGAMAAGVREKDVTLAVARELRRQLAETGRYRVVLTRDRDTYIKLRERLALSRKAGGDVFVSIHADKIARKGVRGASIYTLSENASDEEAARLAEDENNAGIVAGVDLKEESQDVADILLDLAMREKMNESNVLAQAVEVTLRSKNVRLLPNSHRSAGFAVLKAPDVPAILIEMGFLSNPEEAKLLSSAAFQRKIATALVDGIDAYFRKMRSLKKAR